MRVLIVNGTTKGGAAIVARRLLEALNAQEGVQATLLSAGKRPLLPCLSTRMLKKALDRFLVWAANGFTRKGLWLTDCGFFGTDITRTKEFQEADVIHLHWLNQGFMSLRDIDKVLHSGKKVVWTLHDMWPLTAICHHAGDCMKFGTEEGCHCCEQLRFPRKNDLSAKIWRKKAKLYKDANVHFIACSSWMASHEQHSLLTRHLPVTVIPNTINIPDVPPVPVVKRDFGKLICFTAARIDTEIKGFDDLLKALQYLKHRADIELILIGGINDEGLLQQIPIPYRYLGYQKDMLGVYASVDCVVNCSRYETLPTTIVEAQSVGTTPVAYCQSGATDLITDGETGYFADYRNTESLAKAIEKAIDNPLNPQKLRQHVIDSYSPAVIARKHLEVFKLIDNG